MFRKKLEDVTLLLRRSDGNGKTESLSDWKAAGWKECKEKSLRSKLNKHKEWSDESLGIVTQFLSL